MTVGKGFIPIEIDGDKFFLGLKEGETITTDEVICMQTSSVQCNTILSSLTDTSHVLMKVNMFPYRTLTSSCHMLAARYNFYFREWEIANNDGAWMSSRPHELENGIVADCTWSLMDVFESAHSIVLYHFVETEPDEKFSAMWKQLD